jgi:xanthine dehydrogenase small subunit
VTTLEGIDPELHSIWTEAFSDSGASQCGFCTPGILMRLAALVARKPDATEADVSGALSAHLCRCTGWRTLFDAVARVQGALPLSACSPRNLAKAARRAEIEGRTAQAVGADVAAGLGGFAEDTAPLDSLVAVPDPSGGWSVAETLTAARRLSGKVQGRKSGAALTWPVDLPDGEWAVSLSTTFVEPAYLEPDASWCIPHREPASPVANGGAFGGKSHSVVTDAARRLADEHNRPVRVVLSREDLVRLGPKRPPIAGGLRADGSGTVRVGRTPGSGDLRDWVTAFSAYLPDCALEIVEIPGPPVSAGLRGAGWVEASVLKAALPKGAGAGASDEAGPVVVVSPDGGEARVSFEGGRFRVVVDAGEVLDEVVLRSYCIGAVHQAYGWVTREGLAVDGAGEVLDLTIRSFGVVPARESPEVEVEIIESEGPAVNVSDAVFAAAAAAVWIDGGLAPRWPTQRGERGAR